MIGINHRIAVSVGMLLVILAVAACEKNGSRISGQMATVAVSNAPFDRNNSLPKSKMISFPKRPHLNGSGSWIAKDRFLTAGHVAISTIINSADEIIISDGPNGDQHKIRFHRADLQVDVPELYLPIAQRSVRGGAVIFSREHIASDMGVIVFSRDMVGEEDLVKLALYGPDIEDKVLLGGYGYGGTLDADGQGQLGKRHVGTGTISNMTDDHGGRAMLMSHPVVFQATPVDTSKALPAAGDSGSLVFNPETGEAVGLVEGANALKEVYLVNFAGNHPDNIAWLKSHAPYFEPLGYDSDNRAIKTGQADADAGDAASSDDSGDGKDLKAADGGRSAARR